MIVEIRVLADDGKVLLCERANAFQEFAWKPSSPGGFPRQGSVGLTRFKYEPSLYNCEPFEAAIRDSMALDPA